MKKPTVNSKVRTPLGEGVVQGKFDTATMADAYLVRLPINDQTRSMLQQSNCMTPGAIFSGLWVFPESDLA